MNLIAIDIETTGLDRDRDQILSVAAVRHQDGAAVIDCPWAVWYVQRDRVEGHPAALVMNSYELRVCGQIDRIPDGAKLVEQSHLYFVLRHFCGDGCTIVGKNAAGFDLPFLERAGVRPFWSHRVLDPGSMWARPDDPDVPSMSMCMERAGIHPDSFGIPHDALRDARCALACVLAKWEDK